MSKLVKIAGIAIAASRVKAKATHVTLLCKNCRSVRTVSCRPGLGGAIVPRSCDHVPQVYSSTVILKYSATCPAIRAILLFPRLEIQARRSGAKNFNKIVLHQAINNIHNLLQNNLTCDRQTS